MANDFEYKIHVSIDQKGLGDDVRKELSKIAQETKDAFKIKLTGDPKDLIKQLVDLKKLVPDLDLTQGIKFELADVIKENTDEGKKLMSDFTTYIINSVNDAVSSIDAISESIKKTQDVLEGFKNRKRELLNDDDTASAVSAFEKAEKRLFDASNKFSKSKQNKGKLAAAEEMKRAYQDILNYQEEAGREMSEKTKQILGVFAQDVDKTFVDITGKEHSLKDFLGDVKVNSSYKKDLQELESQIFSAENKLRDLKKELENAKNPEMKIKGKLADNFLSDLQSQLDAMTGLEVKVKPKIDEDVKLEVEVNGDVKPIDSPNNSNNSSEIKEKKQEIKEISHDLEDVQQHINNIKPQKTQDEIRVEFEKTRNAVDQTVSSQGSYFESLFEKAKTTKLSYEEVIAVVSEAEKISSQFTKHNLELQDTDFAWADGDWEKYDIGFQGAKSDMDNFKQSLSDTYKLYKNVESAIKNNAGMYKGQFYDNSDLDNLRGIFQIIASYANELGIDINSVIESIPRMTKEFKGLAVDAVLQQMNIEENNRQYDGESEELKNINSQLQERYRLLEKILTITTKDDIGKTVDIEGVLSSGILSDFTDKDFQYGNVQTIVGNICKLLGIEIPSAAEKAKEAISETTSASPNTSAMDAVEEELHEEAQAHRENAEAAKADAKAQEEFNNSQDGNKNGLLSDTTTPSVSEYIKKSDDEIYASGRELAKNRETVLQELAQREIDLANQVSGEKKQIYADMANATFKMSKASIEDGDYKIEEKISSTKNQMDSLQREIESETDPKILDGLNRELDETKIKFIALVNAFKQSGHSFSEVDTLSFGSNVIEEYARTQREKYQIGNSNFNIVQEEKEYWDVLTKEIKTEDDLTRAIERQKQALVDLSKKRDEAEQKAISLDYNDPNYKKAQQEWDDTASIYYDEKMKLYNLRQLKSNWGKNADQAPIINANFLDSEWRESDRYLFGIDEEIEQIIEAERREAEQARKTAEEEKKLAEARKQSSTAEQNLAEEKKGVDKVQYSSANNPYKALKKGGLGLQYYNGDEIEALSDDVTKQYEQNVVEIIETNEKFSADAEITCEKAETAIRKFFNTIGKQIPELTGWKDQIIETIQNGEMSMADIDGGLWNWGVEEIEGDEKAWYVYINNTKQAAEETVRLRTELGNLKAYKNKIFTDFGWGGSFQKNIFPEDQEKYLAEEERIIAEVKAGTLNYYDAKEQLYDILTDMTHIKYGADRFTQEAPNHPDVNEFKQGLLEQIKNGSLEASDAIQMVKDKIAELQKAENQNSTTISQLEKEAGLRQENVQLTDAQIEAELKRQSEATNKTTPLTGDEAIVRYIDELDQMYEKEKLTGEELEKLFAASRNADAGSALELLSSELEKASDVLRPEDLSGNLDKVIGKFKELGISITDIRKLLQGDKTSISWVGTNGDRQENISKAIELLKQLGLEVESVNNPDKFNTTITARTQAQVEAFHREKQAAEEVKEVVEELVIDLDKLANHPFPTDDIFTNKKIAAEQSIGQLESVLPYDYQGDVRQQIYDLHTELSKLTEDEGLSLWRTKFEIVAKSVKNVREEMDALAKNQKKAMSEAVSDANLSKGITKARDDIEKMSESMSELGVTKFDEEFKKLNEELGNVGNNSDKLKIVQAKIDELKIGLREAATEAEALLNKQKAVYESLRENIIQKAELEAQNIRYEQKGMQDTYSYKINADKINALEKEIDAVDRLALSEDQLKSIKEAEAEADKKVKQARDLQQQSIKQTEEANKRQAQTLEKTRAALQKQASSLMNNGKLMKQYGDQVHALYEEIQDPSTTISRLEQIRVELNKISAEATAAGKSGKSFFQMLQQRAQSLLAYLGTFASFYRVVGYIRTAITTISDLDTQLVDLRKTTQMNTLELDEFYRASTNVGKELGVTTSEIISQAAAWSRLGYNTKEASEQMAALSSKFASISPGVEIDNATDYLVSTMQAFKKLPEEVERDIMDNINAIGNTMATTNGEIGEMLERSSAAMKAANNTLEETIALEAAAVEITRNAETTGTAFRTISMRIRGYDEETEELSDDLKNISGEIADLTKTTKNAPISIFTDESKSEYKSTYQILKEIAGVWENLTDKQQAQLLEKLGGKRGAQSLAGILADFSSVEEALETMSEAGGSAEREMNIIRESLDFKVNALKQTWVGIIQDLIDRGVISDVIDGLTKISESLGKLITQFGVLKTAVVGIGGLFTAKKFGLLNFLKGDFSGIDNLKNKVIELSVSGQSLKEVSKSINEIQTISASRDIFTPEGINVTTIELYRKSLQGLTVDQKALALSTSGLTKAEIEEVLTRQDSAIVSQAISKAEAEAVISKMGLASATKVLSESELEELGTRVGLEAQTIKNALIETGLVTVKDGDIIATQKLTQSEIEEALTSQGAALADKQQTAQIIAETIAKNQATQATVKYAGTSNLLVGAFNKLKAVITKHPLLTLATIIGGSIYALRKYKNSIDDLIDSSKEIVSTYQSTSKELAKNKGEFDSLSEKYVELSKGVDSLGHNVNLTTDEYEEYRTVVNRIADLSPDLISGYNDQGDAILYIRDSVDALTDSYNKNIIAANNDIIANGTKVMEARKESKLQYGNEDNVNRYRLQSIEELLKGSKNASQLMNDFADLYSGGFMGYEYKDLTKLLNELGIDVGFTKDDEWYTTEAEAAEFNKKLQDTLEHLTSDQRAILEAYVSRKNAEYENIFEGDRELLKAYIQNSLLTDEDLKEIPDNLKTILMNYADNIDVDILSTFDSPEKLSSYASQITNAFKGLSDSQQKQLEFGINLSTSWNNDELSYDEYIKQIQAFNTLLSELFPDNEEIQKTFKILFNIPNEEDLVEQKDVFLNRISETKTSSIKLDPEISDEAIQEEINKGNEVAEAWYNSLTKSERDFVANVSDEDFANTIKFDSTKQFDAWLDKLKNIAAEGIDVKVKASDAVDSMADAKTAITSLEELWNQTVKNNLSLGKDKKYLDENGNVIKQLNDKNQAIGFADPATINSVESAFYKFSEKLKKEGNDPAANEINLALEEFQKTLTEFPGDADKAQEAIDNLITAYIDQTDIIQNLTEENAEWSKAQLEAYGITNAEEVVMSRLSTTTKQLAKQFKSATEALEKLNDAQIDNYDEGSMQSVQDELNSMFSTDALQNGETLTPNFDPTWIIENLDMLKEAAAGSTDAMWELQKVAAQKIAAQIDINAPNPAAVNDIQNQINSLISHFDIKDVKVGTSIDTNPMIKGLNALVDAGTITRDSMNAILSGIGVEPTITYETITVKGNLNSALNQLYNSDTDYNNKKYMGEAMKSGILGSVNVPKIGYKVTSKGVGAKYASPSGGSSSGGGGGGGGGGSSSEPNKPKEEAEETFDWIEVAIQRIEEEIARLDKVVGNSYDAWIRRNEALLKEINKTKDEIKAQQLAQEEYLRNANKVQVNNGRGLNPDDYGENDQLVKAQDQKLLDEAKKAWATGQYQKKVREGLLTGDDIENIQNHFLADTIKFYQELYNKSVQAGDAVQDLKIKLGDLARTNFDHVKSEYEETLAYFDAYSSLIDERINRTEEKGYFVSKKYYSDLIAYDNKSLNALQKEYNDLIKKRDEAVTSGAILSGSSEWNAMNQEILDVANSIEQATTKLIEFSNQMRQIDWDVFDFLQDRIGKVNDEFEFLVDLLDNQKLYDDWGMFNERGWADTALHASKYNTYMQQALDYAKEREKIEGELAKDRADKNLIERREELIQLQQESIKNAYAEKEAVKDLVSEGINIHLQALQKLIDDYKKAQQESKSLYDYQKNIAKQTENIGNLRKQLNAYAGDTSEEARATIQRLNQQLKDAEQSLQETEWDKYISETQTFLDDMYKDYEETLNKRLDDIDLLMHDMINSVNGRGGEIRDIINTVSGEVGYRLTENANTFLKNGTLVSDFKTNFDTYATTTEKMLNDIKNYVSSISNKTVAEGINNTEKLQNPTRVNGFNTTYKGVDYGSVFDLNYYMQKYPDLLKAFGNDYDKYLEHFVNHGMKEGRQASETFDVKYYRNKYADLNGHWGNDWEQYYKHFLNHGIQEGRQGSAEFDVQKYKASYTDLQKNLGNVLGRYYKHYNQYGISEGRQGNTFIRDGIDYSPVFNPKYYADRWSDLKKWYGYDSTKLFNHFVDHGMKEGRQASANFNPAKYKEYYKDLQNAFGSDWKKYFIHYLNHGIAEGRKGYKVGAHNISTAQMAWTQEAGGELIYRSTDGAILTPLNVGDKVFTAEMSENLWNLAQLKQRPFVPTNTGGKTINNTNAISITLPNVQNYEQFKTAMQNDPKMTQFIQQITLGEATNGVKLNKKRY